MIKAITPVPLLMLYFISGRETPSLLQLLIVLLICGGVIISSVGELLFTWTGFLLQVTNYFIRFSVFIMFNLILI